MAINKNHEFEELNGVKCGIVEKNVSKERAGFLQRLLEHNGYAVVLQLTPPPKVAAPAPSVEVPATIPEAPAPPETFTIGVTDVMFNPINAIFGRLLKAEDGNIVTLAYWRQQESRPNDSVPYYEKGF